MLTDADRAAITAIYINRRKERFAGYSAEWRLAEEAFDAGKSAGAREQAERDAGAVRFAGMILDCYADSWAADFDGGTLEDWADECGLMKWIDITPETDESDRCGNCDGDCDRCHRYTKAAEDARRFADTFRAAAGER